MLIDFKGYLVHRRNEKSKSIGPLWTGHSWLNKKHRLHKKISAEESAGITQNRSSTILLSCVTYLAYIWDLINASYQESNTQAGRFPGYVDGINLEKFCSAGLIFFGWTLSGSGIVVRQAIRITKILIMLRMEFAGTLSASLLQLQFLWSSVNSDYGFELWNN